LIGHSPPRRTAALLTAVVILAVATAAPAQKPLNPQPTEIEIFFKEYKAALEDENVGAFADINVKFDKRGRDSLQQYFDIADDLRVNISDEDIAVEGDGVVATFTRSDQFRTHGNGKDVQLEVRLSALLTNQGGHWKIRALRKPSEASALRSKSAQSPG
jgi:hypothetical protein